MCRRPVHLCDLLVCIFSEMASISSCVKGKLLCLMIKKKNAPYFPLSLLFHIPNMDPSLWSHRFFFSMFKMTYTVFCPLCLKIVTTLQGGVMLLSLILDRFLFFIYLNVYFERERERERENMHRQGKGREREGGRERIPSRLCTVSTGLTQGLIL